MISVAMATYNGQKYIKQQLDSIIAQTLPPSEIIIVDDVSEDNTVEIVKKLSEKTTIPIYVYMNEENSGVAKSFHRAVQLCQSEFIAFSDQDDIWYLNKLEILFNKLNNLPHKQLIFSDVEVVDKNNVSLNYTQWDAHGFTKKEQARYNSGHELEVVLKRGVANGMAMLFRKSLLEGEEIYNDFWTYFLHDGYLERKSALMQSSIVLDRPLVRYRLHDNNVIGAGRLFSTVENYEKMTKTHVAYKNKVIECEQLLRIIKKNEEKYNIVKNKKLILRRIHFFNFRQSLPGNFLIRFLK